MEFFDKIYAIILKDLKQWFRNPFLIIIAVAPLLLILGFIGGFLTRAETLPTGVILEDNDTIALELKDYLVNAESGSYIKWFEVRDLSPKDIEQQFLEGAILCYIVLPANLSSQLVTNNTAAIEVKINNINDDVTKNVLQRVSNACNYVNNNLTINSTTYYTPKINYQKVVPTDISFTAYTCASICALAILLSSGVNTATTTSYEFERNTSKELLLAGSPAEIVTGKILVSIIQTLIIFGTILLVAFLLFGFVPSGNIFFLIFLVLWGAITFASVGFLAATVIRHIIPSAVSILILNIVGWWIGGGLIPPEVTTGFIHVLSYLWPGTYFIRMFTNSILLGWINTPTLWVDFVVTGLFGLVTYTTAIYLFLKQVKK
ncbi:ABC transporter permease [Candidatus Heimdallarchaeota archaeon]|nr:MAG: ABC transporter permease [Candidatus Heimdallarchaeota archaeon]